MTLTSVTLRSMLYACGFVWLWMWVAMLLRRFDEVLTVKLPGGSSTLAIPVLAVGAIVIGWCLAAFIVRGRGTPALFDAPRHLVSVGPYRYVRNPMYVGAGLLLLGFGFWQTSPAIVLFVPVWWLLFHLLVVVYEERALRGRFGPEYEQYCRRTPRWLPTLAPRVYAGCVVLLVLGSAALLSGADQKPNFTGNWKLNAAKSDFGMLPGPDRRVDEIRHTEPTVSLVSRQTRGDRETTGQCECRTDGTACTMSINSGNLQFASQVRWDDTVLVFDSRGEYNGSQVRIFDRWTLSPDGTILTIVRRLSNDTGETHQKLVLEKQ